MSFELLATPAAACAARRSLTAAKGTLTAGKRGDVLLMVTELMTSVARHADDGRHQPIRGELGMGSELVRVRSADLALLDAKRRGGRPAPASLEVIV